MQDKASRPQMADYNAPIADVDIIFVGFSIWWYVASHIINSFLEAYYFSGKIIVLFATSGSSDFGRTLKTLEDSVRGTVHLMEGNILNGKPEKEDLAEWVNTLISSAYERKISNNYLYQLTDFATTGPFLLNGALSFYQELLKRQLTEEE